ncbi:TPA: endonuclease/exonuclease/phosphatase family protein [Candidatus Poribacteria bacterium]|nr:endonuclease/exonuclease/phosphatase family protein [Candidatus Poribacteria bacterium]
MNNVDMLSYRLVRFAVSAVFFAIVFLSCTSHHIKADAIAIDGKFGDWDHKAVLVVDPVDAKDGFVDLGSIRYASDGRFLHLMLELRRTVNLQAMDGRLTLYFDADGDVTTGRADGSLPGANLAIVCTAPTDRHTEAAGMGLAVEVYHRSPTDNTVWQESPYKLGILFAPTIASSQSELRIERGVNLHGRMLFTGKKVTMCITATTVAGDVVDASRSLTLHLPELETTSWEPASEVSLERVAGTHLRVITWNIERGSILDTPLPFVRTLRTLNADIILLEELTDHQSQHTVETFFNDHCPLNNNARWHVQLGSGGGNLRCAVVSSFPIKTIGALDIIPYENRTDRSVRQASCIVDVDGTHVFVCAIHLKCCGHVNSREEVTRLTEVRSLINCNR